MFRVCGAFLPNAYRISYNIRCVSREESFDLMKCCQVQQVMAWSTDCMRISLIQYVMEITFHYMVNTSKTGKNTPN